MTECPWCGNDFENVENICPYCKHEVLPEHVESNYESETAKGNEEPLLDFMAREAKREEQQEDSRLERYGHYGADPELTIITRFNCVKCGHDHCVTEQVELQGKGNGEVGFMSCVAAACQHCGYVELYHSDIVRRSTMKHQTER